jgi:NAD-dependent SIR2 family protein deacetylase
MRSVDVFSVDLEPRPQNPAILLLEPAATVDLNPLGFVERIIWGWKRDSASPRLSRLIYFGGRLKRREAGLHLEDSFLFYTHWGEPEAMEPVIRQIDGRGPTGRLGDALTVEALEPTGGWRMLRIVSGRPTGRDLFRLHSLARREPDPPQPTPPRIPSSGRFNLRDHGVTGCDLLAGSGLSYEAGLPMLKEVHDLFDVDDGYRGFCLGAKDRFPRRLLEDQEGTFQEFAQWHIQAARTRPSRAHEALLQLRRSGFLHRVFTDNIDRLFDLVGITDYEQVRGSGVVNEFHPAEFSQDSNALLVIGVSADRRGVLAQARERGMKLVVVNPYLPVSPGAKNLDYLRAGDVYFRMTAGQAVPRIVAGTLGQRLLT